MKLKCLLIILFVLFYSTNGSACDRWYRIQKNGILIVGVEASYPPFEDINDKGELVGFDIDLIRLIAREMGLKVEFKLMIFDDIFPKVLNGEVDLGLSCISVTENRKKIYDFTYPYYRSGQITVVGPKAGIYNMESLFGKVIYVQKGSTGAEMAETIPGAQLRLVDDFQDVVGLMERGDPVAIVTDRALADYYRQQRGFMTVGSPLSYEEIAIMIAKGCPILRVSLNEALRELSEKGEIRRLREKWNL